MLTLSGTDTPQDYQAGAQVRDHDGHHRWQHRPGDDRLADHRSAGSAPVGSIATSTVEVTASLTPPHPHNPYFLNPDNFDHGHFGDFSGMVTNAQFRVAHRWIQLRSGNAVYVIHSDVNPTVADNGSIGFDLALNQLEAALGGDVVSVTATLANGQPLPAWLAFLNADTGQFVGSGRTI